MAFRKTAEDLIDVLRGAGYEPRPYSGAGGRCVAADVGPARMPGIGADLGREWARRACFDGAVAYWPRVGWPAGRDGRS